MKVVIFGADKAGIDFYLDIRKREEVAAFIDNSAEKQGKEILGVKVLTAEALLTLEFDKIYIASKYHFKEIEKQICELGVLQDKVSFLPIQISKDKKIPDDLYQFQELYRKEEYDAAWEKIKKQYRSIKVYGLRVDAIGEFITRFFMIRNVCDEDGILKVFVPEIGVAKRICNKYLIELLGRKIYIVQENDALFWAYIFKNYAKDLDISEYDKYSIRNDYLTYKVERENIENWFYDEEVTKGKVAFEQMGLSKPYVCFAARTATYNKKTIGHDFSYDFRNMNFDEYKIAINLLQQQNITAVKMGRMEEPMKRMEGCIDYAGLYAGDFKDLYLASECEFMIANSTGTVYMASLFSKPVLMVNAVPVSFGFGGIQYTDKDLYIPKKYYDMNKNRYLSFREMMEVEMQCLIYGNRYENMGIKFIDNTPEEIADAAQEMLERLGDRWQDSTEDQKNYERYLEIYHEMERNAADNPDIWLGGPMPQRIAASYLRNNLYLII